MSDKNESQDGGRSLLIHTALELFDSVHPEDLSVREVTRRAGLSSGAPYHHFSNKAELLAACAVVAWTQLCEELENDSGGAPEDRLAARGRAYLRFARTYPGSYQLITSRLLDDTNRFGELAPLRGRAMSGVIDLIVQASTPTLDPIEAKFRGLALWSLLHGHLALDIDAQHSEQADIGIAELAARMALLPALPAPSKAQARPTGS